VELVIDDSKTAARNHAGAWIDGVQAQLEHEPRKRALKLAYLTWYTNGAFECCTVPATSLCRGCIGRRQKIE